MVGKKKKKKKRQQGDWNMTLNKVPMACWCVRRVGNLGWERRTGCEREWK